MSGSIMHAVDSNNHLKRLTVDSNGKLNVTGGGSTTHNAEISNLDSQTGTMLMGYAGTISAVGSTDGCLLSCSTWYIKCK